MRLIWGKICLILLIWNFGDICGEFMIQPLTLTSDTGEKEVLGIDFGTQNILVSYKNSTTITLLPLGNPQSDTIEKYSIPAIICFDKNLNVIMDEEATRISLIQPGRCIMSPKRFIGKRIFEVRKFLKDLPYDAMEFNDQICFYLTILPKPACIPEVTTYMLNHVLKKANLYLKRNFTEAIITVPTSFDFKQRIEIKYAAQKGGIEKSRIYDEPLAACYLYQKSRSHFNLPDGSIGTLIDFGAGTINIIAFSIDKGKTKLYSQVGEDIGGNDFTQNLKNFLKSKLPSTHNSLTKVQNAELFNLAEKKKIELSTQNDASFSFNKNIFSSTVDGTVSRTEFEKINQQLFDKFKAALDRLFEGGADLDIANIDYVLLIGGSSKMAKVKSIVHNFFEETTIILEEYSQNAVAMGASLIPFNPSVVDQAPSMIVYQSIGIELDGYKIEHLISRNSPISPNITKSITVYKEQTDQNEIPINIYQGEDQIPEEKHRLATLTLYNLNYFDNFKGYNVTLLIENDRTLKIDVQDNEFPNNQIKKEIELHGESLDFLFY